MNMAFLWALAWSAHPSLVRKCCSLDTSLSISNNTITLYRREFSLNKTKMTVIGTYSSRLYTCIYRRLRAKRSYLTLVRVADRILQLWGDNILYVGVAWIDSLRNVLRWSHAPSSKLATKMDFCSSRQSWIVCIFILDKLIGSAFMKLKCHVHL